MHRLLICLSLMKSWFISVTKIYKISGNQNTKHFVLSKENFMELSKPIYSQTSGILLDKLENI